MLDANHLDTAHPPKVAQIYLQRIIPMLMRNNECKPRHQEGINGQSFPTNIRMQIADAVCKRFTNLGIWELRAETDMRIRTLKWKYMRSVLREVFHAAIETITMGQKDYPFGDALDIDTELVYLDALKEVLDSMVWSDDEGFPKEEEML